MKTEPKKQWMVIRRVEFATGEAVMTPVDFAESEQDALRMKNDQTMVLSGFLNMKIAGSGVGDSPEITLSEWLLRFGMRHIGMDAVPITVKPATMLKVVGAGTLSRLERK